MNCAITEQQLALFSSGDLDAPDLSRVSAHLAECSGCRQSLADFERTSRVLSGAFGEPDTYDLFALRAAVRSRIHSSRRPFVRRWSLAVIVLLLAVLSLPVPQHRQTSSVVTELPIPSRALPQYRPHLDLPIPVRAARRPRPARPAPSMEAGLRNVEFTTTPQGKSELLIATADPNVLILLPMDNNPHEN